MRVALALLASCSSSASPPVTSCADSLAGVWHSDAGDWMLIDRGARIEGYPLFDDSKAPAEPGVEVAPRALTIDREGPELGGEITRRYMHAGDACVAKVPLHVLACANNTLEVILADTSAPTQFTPCTYSARMNPSRREKWSR